MTLRSHASEDTPVADQDDDGWELLADDTGADEGDWEGQDESSMKDASIPCRAFSEVGSRIERFPSTPM